MKASSRLVIFVIALTTISILAHADTYYTQTMGQSGMSKVEGNSKEVKPDYWIARQYGTFCGRPGWGGYCNDKDGNCYFKTAQDAVAAAEYERKKFEDNFAWETKNWPGHVLTDWRCVAPIAYFITSHKATSTTLSVGPAMKGALVNLYEDWKGKLESCLQDLVAYKTGIKWLSPESRPILLGVIESVKGAYDRVKKLKGVIDNDNQLSQLGTTLQAFVNETAKTVNSAQLQYRNFNGIIGAETPSNQMVTNKNPVLVSSPLTNARQLAMDGKLADAEAAYRQILTDQPKNGRALLELGALLLANGKSKEAEEQLREAAKTLITDFIVHLLLGKSLSAQGRFDEAYKEIQVVSNMKPTPYIQQAMINHVRESRIAAAAKPSVTTKATPPAPTNPPVTSPANSPTPSNPTTVEIDPAIKQMLESAIDNADRMIKNNSDPGWVEVKNILLKARDALNSGKIDEASNLANEANTKIMALAAKISK